MRPNARQTASRARALAREGAARVPAAYASVRKCAREGWEAAAPVRKGAGYLYKAAVHDHMRMRWRIAIAVAALMLAGVVQRAEADTLHITHVHYNAGSGPLNTGIALGLARARDTRPVPRNQRFSPA